MRTGGRQISIFFIFGFLLTSAVILPAADSSSLNLWISSSGELVQSGRTTNLDIRIRYRGDITVENINVRAEAPADIRFRLLSTEINQIIPKDEFILKAEISAPWSIYRRLETIILTFNNAGEITTRNFQIQICPVSWFWPLTGGMIGLIVVLVFIAVFRRVSKGD